MNVADAIAEARRAAEAMRAEYPELEGDADIWDSSIESLTDAPAVADWLIRKALERESLAEAAAERAKATQARAQRFAKAGKSARTAALAIYEAAGIRKREQPDFTASVTAGRPGVVVTDARALPERFLRHPPPEPDKAALLVALKAGELVTGATLNNSPNSLTVRTR